MLFCFFYLFIDSLINNNKILSFSYKIFKFLFKKMDNPRIIGSKLVHEGYIYTRSRPGPDTKNYWDCQKLKKKLCTSRVITLGEGDNVRITKSTPHDHAPDRELAKAEVVKLYREHEELGTVLEYLRSIAHTIVFE